MADDFGLTLGWFEMIGYRRHSMVIAIQSTPSLPHPSGVHPLPLYSPGPLLPEKKKVRKDDIYGFILPF